MDKRNIMLKPREKLKGGLFFIFIGIIYYFSFSGLNIGDSFFRSLENGYPLFFKNIFGKYPAWFGFEKGHFLNIPTLRGIQLFAAKIGLLPGPLFLIQMLNLCLALATLVLFHAILIRLKIGDIMAKATTALFAFSFGFYANMNGEIHHFSVLLLAAVILLLLNIESRQAPAARTIFVFSSCLALVPLYHMECIIYAAIIVSYILFKKDLRLKFKSGAAFVILGAVILPVFLIASSIVFHYLNNYIEIGEPNFANYFKNLLPRYLRSESENSYAAELFGRFNLINIYIMLRAQLESFSISSRLLKIFQHYKDVAFYSDNFHLYATMAITAIYQVLFLFVNIFVFFSILRVWKKTAALVKLLIVMLITYLIAFGIPLCNHALLSEFFITSVLIQCMLLGYFLNKSGKWLRLVFYALVIFTFVSNIFLYIYPQKVSAQSINTIFNDIESKNKTTQELSLFRVSFFDFPYETGGRSKLRIYLDEHAYDSREDTAAYLKLISNRISSGSKVYLIGPGFLFKDGGQVNVRSVMPMAMEKAALIENLEYFLKGLGNNYEMSVTRNYSYNFGTLGQLGKIAVVELKPVR